MRDISNLHLGVAAIFALGAIYSGFKLLSSRNVIIKHRFLSSSTPKITREEFVSIIGEIRLQAEKVVEAAENSLRLPSAVNEDTNSLEAGIRVIVQNKVKDIQKAVFEKHNLTEADMDHAVAYYTNGQGKHDSSVNAVLLLKKAIGKYMLTKEALLDVMRQTFDIQARIMRDEVKAAAGRGRIRSMEDVQRLLNSPMFMAQVKTETDRLTMNATGLTVMDIDAITNSDAYKNDVAFGNALSAVASEGQQLMEQAQQEVMQMLGGGRGMGMMGF